MVADTTGAWRSFTWLCAALAAADSVFMYLAFPESNFRRPVVQTDTIQASATSSTPAQKSIGGEHCESQPVRDDLGAQQVVNVVIPWKRVWRTLVHYNNELSFLRAFSQPFVFLTCPNVLWAILVYGTALGAQIILM
jgi:hypothetical protein